MEQQEFQNYGEMDDEEFPNEFQCCVCLDILYKPVVLACGHISCFWCVFKAMDTYQGSHCPVCGNPYNHFPRICEMLHFLLLKLCPRAYKRREGQVAEEEKGYGHESPQFDGNFIASQLSNVLEVQNITSPFLGSVPADPNSTCGGAHSLVQYSSQGTFHKDNTTTIPTTSSPQTTTNDANSMVEHTNKVLMTDLQCAACKQLLCRPVVLNCGHVYCEACINRDDSVCKCSMCQSVHPKGFPIVCLILEHFLEEHFPEEYSARKASLPRSQTAGPSGSSGEKQEQAAQSKSVPAYAHSSLFSENGANFHPFVGCDHCGMCPIIGLRYRCKDCVEKIGFDLCEGCHNSSSNLPGRFNQQHTKDHQFEVLRPGDWRRTILRLGGEQPGAYDDVHIVYLSSDAPEDDTTSLNSSGDDTHDVGNAIASPDPSNNRPEDQVDDSAT